MSAELFSPGVPLTLRYAPPPVDRREIWRYAGCRGAAGAPLEALLEECLAEALPALDYRACACAYPVVRASGALELGFAAVRSESLAKNLAGCGRVLLFAATVGLELDRLIARAQSGAPARALLLQAIGAKRGMLVSGGEVDTERAAKMLIGEFRASKWGRLSLERPPQRQQEQEETDDAGDCESEEG